MVRKMTRIPSAVALGLTVTIGWVLGPAVEAEAAPVVPAGFEAEVFATPVTQPFHLAVDSDGSLFVGNATSGMARIHMVSPDGSTVVPFGAPIEDPDAVIVDINGAVATLGSVLVGGFVDSNHSRITQISPDGSVTSLLFEGGPPNFYINNPQAVCLYLRWHASFCQLRPPHDAV